MSRTRILLLLHELSLTGAPKVALDALGALSNDVEVCVVSLAGGPRIEQARQLGPLTVLPEQIVKLLGHDHSRDGTSLKRAYMRAKTGVVRPALRRLQSRIVAWRPDVIYVNSVAALPLLRLLSLPALPTLLHVHEMGIAIQAALAEGDTILQEKPDRYVAVSQPVADVLADRFGIPRDKITLIHECVPDSLVEAVIPRTAASPGAPLVVGGAGQHNWRKGTILWLQMARELRSRLGHEAVRFVWVGVPDNNEGRMFRDTARLFALEDCVEFVPVTSEPLTYYTDFDVFAMTSLEDPCPIVVLENMLLEKPVVCFTGGGAPEEVGDTGIVIENFCTRGMADAIAELAHAPERRAALGRAARARVETHFTASVQAPKLLTELRRLLA